MVIEHRRATRYSVDRHYVGEHRQLGDIMLHVANVSTSGFMTATATGLPLGDRVIIRLPLVGRIEAYLVWTLDERAGFKFERLIRDDQFALMLDEMQPIQRSAA